MGKVDPDRASTNEAKWMWTINTRTPCLLLSPGTRTGYLVIIFSSRRLLFCVCRRYRRLLCPAV
ncbi:hypothetical protein V8C37DRAFT_385206, partial [Trichoderma ceciliae]